MDFNKEFGAMVICLSHVVTVIPKSLIHNAYSNCWMMYSSVLACEFSNAGSTQEK